MLTHRDPIIAQASAIGRAGVGVIRISGKDLSAFILRIYPRPLAPRNAVLVSIRDQQQQVIDQGLCTYFPAPNSFTGEDVVEFHGHGGILVMSLVIQRFLEMGQDIGLRGARPGEFTERAFLNNKIDLTQAEAVADLIDASSVAAIKSANRSLKGVFSEKINALVEKLTHLRILVEASLDFPEEEIDFLENANALLQWQNIHQELLDVLQASKQGAILRNGALVVLAGAPNVGKSSLINQLAQEEIAIVTPVAGTTRDRIRVEISLDGIPIQVVDTAGLRQSDDAVEKIGIERSWATIQEADIVIFMRDASSTKQSDSEDLFARVQELTKKTVEHPAHLIEIWNKQDQISTPVEKEQLYISAKTGFGIADLKSRILHALGWESQSDNLILARQRHLDALKQALVHIHLAQTFLVQGNAHLELFAEELRLAQDVLGDITGKLFPDDLLGKIFSSFCIGK